MLQEQELKTFVEGTTNYFEVAAQQPASIGSPYLTEGSPAVHDYTGVINISGKREGVNNFPSTSAQTSSDQPSNQGVTSPRGSTIASRSRAGLPIIVQSR